LAKDFAQGTPNLWFGLESLNEIFVRQAALTIWEQVEVICLAGSWSRDRDSRQAILFGAKRWLAFAQVREVD
jgi:hypothetical protein